jgi:hypothetical protein
MTPALLAGLGALLLVLAAPGSARDGEQTWRTPKGLARGRYTYFCRVHRFMRGAFKVRRR